MNNKTAKAVSKVAKHVQALLDKAAKKHPSAEHATKKPNHNSTEDKKNSKKEKQHMHKSTQITGSAKANKPAANKANKANKAQKTSVPARNTVHTVGKRMSTSIKTPERLSKRIEALNERLTRVNAQVQRDIDRAVKELAAWTAAESKHRMAMATTAASAKTKSTKSGKHAKKDAKPTKKAVKLNGK
jgi:hypothetical protein